ncbi:MAG: diguanylate cyclase [Pseudomonadota bacterium]
MSLQGIAMWVTIVVSFEVGFASEGVVAIWPAAGIAIAMAIYYRWAAFLPIFLSNFAYSLMFQTDQLGFYLWSNAGNAFATVLAAWIYRQVGGPKQPLRSVAGVVKMVVVLALAMSVMAAVIGTVSVYLAFGLSGPALWQVAWRWFFSDFTGAVIVAPALLAVFGSFRRWRAGYWRRAFEEMWVPGLVSVGAMVALYFASNLMPDALGQYPTVLLTMPLCVWLCLRSHTPSSMALLTATVIGALAMTLTAIGDATESGFLAVQLYGLVAMCTSLVLHASTAERWHAVRALASERQLLESTVLERTAALRDQIAANEAANDELARLARTDPLTGAANRREFAEQVGRELSRVRRHGSRLSIVMLDIDHFKAINDTYGHAAGDAVLQQLAESLLERVRRDIDLVARLGGEEFACVLPDTPLENGVAFAERMRQVIAALQVTFEGRKIQLTASFGVAEPPQDVRDIDAALKPADEALYLAKAAGRNRVEPSADSDPDSRNVGVA